MTRKNGDKILIRLIICVLAIMLGTGAAFAAAVPADVADSAHKDAITALVEADVITGSTDGLFHPFDNLTRAQACIIVVKALNPPNAEVAGTPSQKAPKSGFPDMSGYGWADGYVSYAVKHGIVNGYPDGTFMPGNNVTCNEMLAMILRATGYKDSEIGSWPKDYIAKAETEGITKGFAEGLPVLATKEIAAQMTYNKFDALRTFGAVDNEGNDGDNEGNDGDTTSDAGSLTFATGKFNDNMTAFAGTPISAKAVIYTYGVKADYKKDMKLPAKEGEMRKDTVNKFKLAETPCFYEKTGNEITKMILPMDAGFTGRIYCVINDSSKTVNGKGESVNSIKTLAAAQQVSWLTKDDNLTAPPQAEYLDGEVYEMAADGGTIKSISKAGGGHKDFKEITASWGKVKEFDGTVITLDSEKMITTEATTVVYVLNRDGKSYKAGWLSDIKAGVEIRAFTIKDEGVIAQYITLKQK